MHSKNWLNRNLLTTLVATLLGAPLQVMASGQPPGSCSSAYEPYNKFRAALTSNLPISQGLLEGQSSVNWHEISNKSARDLQGELAALRATLLVLHSTEPTRILNRALSEFPHPALGKTAHLNLGDLLSAFRSNTFFVFEGFDAGKQVTVPISEREGITSQLIYELDRIGDKRVGRQVLREELDEYSLRRGYWGITEILAGILRATRENLAELNGILIRQNQLTENYLRYAEQDTDEEYSSLEGLPPGEINAHIARRLDAIQRNHALQRLSSYSAIFGNRLTQLTLQISRLSRVLSLLVWIDQQFQTMSEAEQNLLGVESSQGGLLISLNREQWHTLAAEHQPEHPSGHHEYRLQTRLRMQQQLFKLLVSIQLSYGNTHSLFERITEDFFHSLDSAQKMTFKNGRALGIYLRLFEEEMSRSGDFVPGDSPILNLLRVFELRSGL